MERRSIKNMDRKPVNGGMLPIARDFFEKTLHRRDFKDLKLPKDFDKIKWSSIEFLAWKHPSGHRGYILETESGVPKIWVLESETKASLNKRPVMCSLCMHIGSGSSVSLFCYRPENNRNKIVGNYLCSDLNCVDNVSKINPNSMRETLTNDEKRDRMVKNLHNLTTTWSRANEKTI